MDFMKQMELNQKSYTENGGVGFATTGSKLADLNFAIPSYRHEINTDLFEEALQEDKNLTLRWLLFLRDIRQGVGERKSFREFLRYLCEYDEKLARQFIKTVPIEEYGRWDDYVALLEGTSAKVKKTIMMKLAVQWAEDLAYMEQGKPISLLGKWLPSENSSSPRTKKLAKFIRASLNLSSKEYRQKLSKLRKYIDVVERKMSANQWSEVKYENVPSKANLIYANAFMEHDTIRREAYLESLKVGETKINANALFLHDIVHKYTRGHYSPPVKEYDETLEQLWKAQNKVEGFSDTVVVRDGSGSMWCSIGSSNISALDVADAITLYAAENNSGVFKNKFITFSHKAKVVDVSTKKSLHDKLERLRKESDYFNTDIENVFDLILTTVVKNNVSQEDMPKIVLIISDMEFDEVNNEYSEGVSDFEKIAGRFNNQGYKLPKLVFWNVNSGTNTIPLTQNENGVILLSGFSKNLMNMVMSSELDPYKALVKELTKSRYDVIDEIFS